MSKLFRLVLKLGFILGLATMAKRIYNIYGSPHAEPENKVGDLPKPDTAKKAEGPKAESKTKSNISSISDAPGTTAAAPEAAVVKKASTKKPAKKKASGQNPPS